MHRAHSLADGADHAARHLVVSEHELHVDVELVVREEPRQGLECLVRSPAGQKPLVLSSRQGTEPDPHARLLVPDLVAHDGAEPDLVGGPPPPLSLGSERAERVRGQRIPAADELLDLDRHAEVVPQHVLKGDGRPLLRTAGLREWK